MDPNSYIKLSLGQIMVFEAVARLQSHVLAARELGITQPSVTMLLQRLESHLDVKLIGRQGKTSYVTPIGRDLLPYAREIILSMRTMQQMARQLHEAPEGTLNLCFVQGASEFLSPLIAGFNQQYPGIRTRVFLCSRAELAQRLKTSKSDIGILIHPLADDGALLSDPFGEARYQIVAHPQHHLASRKKVSAALLLREPFITREHENDSWVVLTRIFGERLSSLRVIYEVGSFYDIVNFVLNGSGVACLPMTISAPYVKNGQLVALDLEDLPGGYQWHIVTRSAGPLPPVATAFHDFVLTEGGKVLEAVYNSTAGALPVKSRQKKSGRGQVRAPSKRRG